MSKYLPEGITDDDLPGYWDIECPWCDQSDPTDDCDLCDGTGIADRREYDAYCSERLATSMAEDRAEEARRG